MMMNKTTVIFDMDGVLFDSEMCYIKEILTFYKQYGIELTFEECIQIVGVDNRIFNEMMFNWWQNRTSKEEFFVLLDEYYASLNRDYNAIINPYVKELLDYLKKHHYKIALASSSSEQLIDRALTSTGIKSYFDCITSGDSFAQSKPHPEIYLYTVAKLNSSLSETLIIEDSEHGIQAAVNAGIDVLALKDKQFHLDQSKATHLIDDLSEVIHYLSTKNRCL